MAASNNPVIVAAIDFGTTFSGWAFSFKHDFTIGSSKIETKQWNDSRGVSLKGPTAILIQPDGKTFHSFGYDAETEYAHLVANGEHMDWFFFRGFKMQLFDNERLVRDMKLNDIRGKPLEASTVFGLSIRFMKEDLLSTVKPRLPVEVGVTDFSEVIHWVLTVPAIWTDAAKQFMREAAEWAGIPHKALIIALEPECASIFCRTVPFVMSSASSSLKPLTYGSKYILVDAGGGTVDMTVHEVTETGALRELSKPCGGACGGTRVDAAFVVFLNELFGEPVIKTFKEQELEDSLGLIRDFEIKKREVKDDTKMPITITLPASLLTLFTEMSGSDFATALSSSRYAPLLTLHGNKLKIPHQIMRDFFNDSITGTIRAVSNILEDPSAAGVTQLVLVGGLSESTIYRDAIEHQFPQLNVVVPQDASLAVLKGAVMFGHDPLTVKERVIRYTYGFSANHLSVHNCSHPVGRQERDDNGEMRCEDLFKMYVKMGQRVKVGTSIYGQTGYTITDNQSIVSTEIYASVGETPQLVTEPSCIKIGKITAPITDRGRNKPFTISMTFGGTEIAVSLKEESTGAIVHATANFLG